MLHESDHLGVILSEAKDLAPVKNLHCVQSDSDCHPEEPKATKDLAAL